MNTKLKLIAASVLVLNLTACATWLEDRVNAPTELTAIQATSSLVLRYETKSPEADFGLYAPAYQHGTWWLAGDNGRLVQVDAATGNVLGQKSIKQNLVAGVAASSDLLFIANDKGEVVALDKDLNPKWTQNLVALASEPPLLIEDRLFVKTKDGKVRAFNALNGDLLWSSTAKNAALQLSLSTPTMLAIGRDVLVVGQTGGKIDVFNQASGQLIFETVIATPKGGTELERVTDIASRPIFDGKHLCAIAYQGRLACVNVSTGAALWSKDMSSSKGLSFDEQHLYVTLDDGTVTALDPNTGEEVWRQNALKYRNVTAPVVLEKDILVADEEGVLHLLSKQNGQLSARLQSGVRGLLAQPIYADGSVLIQGRNGRFAVISQ